jgi:hypothetical protein
MQVKQRTISRNEINLHINLGLFNFQNHETINFCCLGHLIHHILLWQLELPNTGTHFTYFSLFQIPSYPSDGEGSKNTTEVPK